MSKIVFKIKRQENSKADPYWEYFDFKELDESLTVAAVLKFISKKPVNAEGRVVTPVVWAGDCGNACVGACLMLINSRPRLACQTKIESLERPISLEPLSKFTVQRDLLIDRSKIELNLQQMECWRAMDGYHKTKDSSTPVVSSSQTAQAVNSCISCGACLEACPHFQAASDFVGPLTLIQAFRHLSSSKNDSSKDHVIQKLATDAGVLGCCNVQNCQRVCPRNIPITDAIGQLKRMVFKKTVKGFLG